MRSSEHVCRQPAVLRPGSAGLRARSPELDLDDQPPLCRSRQEQCMGGFCRFQRHPVRIKGNAQSNNSEAIRELVLGGLGIALSPVWLFSEDLKAGRVTAILQDYTAESLPIHAVSPANRRQSARVKAFVDYMNRALETAPELKAIK
ncbi:LysR substrate-binding domain-containing protein [Pseudomonas sp. FW305-70]|uniref:LysR substrate-binding domain-containing protein n=1 Tax=Pseudomonas sp. FW305-70 TaxID=2751342 RepID=UPI002115020D|nr:LysR substrate-binding domain-containing protein [Pseudomonas sp. FW305-70]